jgi:hypothetical protein
MTLESNVLVSALVALEQQLVDLPEPPGAVDP